MEISIATVFDDNLIDECKDTAVKNLFGKLPSDFIGGGLEPHKLDTKVDEERVKNHVNHAHQNGMTFNYTFNSPCMANKEYTSEGRRELYRLLEWLSSVQVDSVTVSIPILIEPIKKDFPDIEVKISSSVCVDSVIKAKRYEALGADCIVLDPMAVNRDFRILKAIRKATDIDLELIINNNCLWHCPFLSYHQSCMGHASQNGHDLNTLPSYDYCYLNGCAYKRATDPAAILMADWIRPEDIVHYEDIGYTKFKIIDRATPVEFLVERAKAYSNRRYDGNFLRIIQHFGYRDVVTPQEALDNIYIDNRQLDGFIDFIRENNCSLQYCGRSCRHCHQFADKSVTIHPDFTSEYQARHRQATKRIKSLKQP